MVLDASAVLALLLNEPGAERVSEVVNGSLISAVNLGEIASVYARAGSSSGKIRALLMSLPMEIVPVDSDLALDAGNLQPLCQMAGLSIGDRLCLSLARRHGLVALTADKAWQRIAQTVSVDVELIR